MNLCLVQGDAPGIQPKEEVRVAGNDLKIGRPFQIEPPPRLSQTFNESGFPALPRPKHSHAGKLPETLQEQPLVRPFHMSNY
jgi:hypothetical protein